MCVSTNRPCPTTLLALYSVKVLWVHWKLFLHFDSHVRCCIATSPTSIFFAAVYHHFCQSNKATMPIHILTLFDRKKITTDWSFHSVYDVRWHYCQLFLSPYTETAWSFLVWQTWDIFLRDSAQERLFFSTCQKFPLLFHFSSSHQLGYMFFFPQYWDS